MSKPLWDALIYAAGAVPRLLFEHPDTETLLAAAREDAKYVRAVETLQCSLTELHAAARGMDREDASAAELNCAELNRKAYESEVEVWRMLTQYHASTCKAQRNRLIREAKIELMREQKFRNMYEAALKHVRIQQNLRQNREYFANSLMTRINVFSHSQLMSAAEDGEYAEEVRRFLNQETRSLRTMGTCERNLEVVSRVAAYHAGSGVDTSILTEGCREQDPASLDEELAARADTLRCAPATPRPAARAARIQTLVGE
ncbi:ORF55 [Ranid herpesvirus 1]|uniref:ORF55 n=1 Tax=Ranid herpesvirus 1 TaxID=85655 RepID=Q14VQ3_9VIRU|nr:ORF55 [Ranid herpesvirus 1]ABG25782.1 ORF55 [Ranid herpesvirus 1]